MLVVFVQGKTGPMAWTGDGVGFPSHDGPKPNVGEIWYVEKCGRNKNNTVTFLKLIKPAENGVVIASTPEEQKQIEWATRNAGQPITVHEITKRDEDGKTVVIKTISLWDHKGLKERYNKERKVIVKGDVNVKEEKTEIPTFKSKTKRSKENVLALGA